jgi:hypothetical protein
VLSRDRHDRPVAGLHLVDPLLEHKRDSRFGAGNPQLAVALLRAAAAPRANQPINPTIVYHLAYALHATGEKAEAQRVLEGLLGANAGFPEKAEAEKLLAELKAGR